MQRRIDPGNFADVIEEIRLSWQSQIEQLGDENHPPSPGQAKVVDLSKTDFRDFLPSHISNLFDSLSLLPQAFILKLNFCRFDEHNSGHIQALTLGLMTTKNMEGFEFNHSISPACEQELAEKILLDITNSLMRSPHIKFIVLDGFRVTPQPVCDLLKEHLQKSPAVLIIFVDGLKLKKDSQPSYARLLLFQPAANESDLSSAPANQVLPPKQRLP